jgi:hypothetical protein
MATWATSTLAADGCLVLLCLAAPDWRSVSACVPPIQQVLQDLAQGREFPSCTFAGAGNSARQDWTSGAADCPEQYVRYEDGENTRVASCAYQGVVTVNVNAVPFTRTWWSFSGDTVTEFSPAAKQQLGRWSSRFDDDHADWLARQIPPAPPPIEPGT